MNIIFFGTSDVAARFFKRLGGNPSHNIAAVVTPPDRPAGRGMKVLPSPVKAAALPFAAASGAKIYQPDSLTSFAADFAPELRALSSDVGVVVSYGKMIPRTIFEIPRFGCLNVHFSLLPRYRGAAPIERALINGETETGASVFFIEEKLDAGPLCFRKKTPVADDDDFFTLRDKLMSAGETALDETLDGLERGSLTARPQAGEPTFAPALKKTDGRIDWRKPAAAARDLIRGVVRWPTAFALLPDGKTLKIFKSEAMKFCPVSDGKCPSAAAPAGAVTGMAKGEGFVVACGDGFLKVTEVRPENGARMTAWAFAQGRGIKTGDVLG